jgi:hypothetical protein
MQTTVVDAINLMFTCIFTMEAAIKITAWKRLYFKEGGNIFDFFIVIMSLIEIVISTVVGGNWLAIITLFRIFRIGRVLRLVKSAKSLRVIFSTFILSLPQVANIGALLLLFIYIFAILGVQAFSKVLVNNEMNEYANF